MSAPRIPSRRDGGGGEYTPFCGSGWDNAQVDRLQSENFFLDAREGAYYLGAQEITADGRDRWSGKWMACGRLEAEFNRVMFHVEHCKLSIGDEHDSPKSTSWQRS